MSGRYLLDTNVLSEPVSPKPDPRVLSQIEEHQGQLFTSTVVWHELSFGVERLEPSRRRDILEKYLHDVVLGTVKMVSYDQAAATWHARQRARLAREGRTPAFADGQIAATAATQQMVLVTRNTRQFAPFENLTLENWFS